MRTGLSGSARADRRSGPRRKRAGRHGEIEPDALGCCVRPGARVRDRRGVTSAGGVQVLSRPTRGGCMGGVPLCHAQFSDGFDQRGKVGDKRDLGADRVIAECGGGQQPGRMAQAVPDRRGARDASAGATGGAVKGIGGLTEDPAAQRGRGGVQGVGSGPCGVRCRSGVSASQVADLPGSIIGSAGGMFPDRILFRWDQPLA